MKQKEIDALEPKYTGNTRDLTEGEAEGIVHDPANAESQSSGVDDEIVADGVTAAAAYGIFRRT
ncbi:hypothetical protein B5M42_009860 [Paenibacillus athensensis]|uniref:Uncharacterized protein n=1 Tax=Paenibacillus athensensis TaxID=1967502 RepID=A0A4Y8PQI7_9BACL|nr:hypothetical protein [Paenibacillus athensensis]MCD1259143.1 hypothetical protein [Paenibacillus athensensis]